MLTLQMNNKKAATRTLRQRCALSNAFHPFRLEFIFYSNLFHHNEQFCVDRSDSTMLLISDCVWLARFFLSYSEIPPFPRAQTHIQTSIVYRRCILYSLSLARSLSPCRDLDYMAFVWCFAHFNGIATKW